MLSSLFIFILMIIFALVTWSIGRRSGSGISRRPFNQPYTDAPGARTEL